MSNRVAYLDPGRVRLFREPKWTVRLTIEGDRSFPKVRIVKIAPLSLPDGCISFLDSKNKQIGMLKSLDGLDQRSKLIIQEELDKRYLTFTVQRINSVLAEFGIGINPGARVDADVMESEQARGTCHFGFGHNVGFGGQNRSEVHVDLVVLQPTIEVNGKILCEAGKYLFEGA